MNAPAVPTALDALVWYVAHGRRARQAPRLADCVSAYLRTRQEAGRAPGTVRSLRSVLHRFALRHGHRLPAEVDPSAIEPFLAQWTNGNTRRAQFGRLAEFFGWLLHQGYVFHNPVHAAMAHPRCQPGHSGLYTPAEAHAFLRAATPTDQLGFWVLSLFAGLRTSEIIRLSAEPFPWNLLRLDAGLIEIPAHCSKIQGRVIPLSSPLRPWLAILRDRNLPLFPPDGESKIRRLRRAVLTRLRGPGRHLVSNAARRSFISYSLALPNASYLTVAAIAGNSEAVIRRYYRRDVEASAAEKYFSLRPRP